MASTILLHIALIICVTESVWCSFYDEPSSREYVKISGDIKLGALVAIHDAGGQVNRRCNSSHISPFGMVRLEAMKFAINQVFKKPLLCLCCLQEALIMADIHTKGVSKSISSPSSFYD